MNNLENITSINDLNIRKIEQKKNIKIIDTDKGKFVLKRKNNNDEGLYNYLESKDFDYILEKKDIDEYDIFPFIEEENIPKEEKSIDLVYILSLLHNKTLYYQNVVLDEVKKTYEELNKKIDYLNKYYFDMQDIIEQKIYQSPEEYLLIRNMSLVYSSLNYSKEKLQEWYQYKITQKKERIVLLHNKPSLDHFLIGNKKQLISWDKYKRNIPIYDFLYFYKTNYLDVEMASLFELYQSKFSYTKDEYLLFLSLITIPEKIVFTNHHFYDCQKVYEMIIYLNKTKDFVLKENEKYKYEEKNEFKKH